MNWVLNFLFLFNFSPSNQLDLSSQSFRTLQQRAGTYHLINGTQGCPAEVSWETQCRGIVLFNHSSSTSLPYRNEFCDLNLPAQKIQRRLFQGLQTTKIQSSFQENIIKKIELQSFRSRSERFETESTQVLILDAADSFLWERDHFGSGTSCLYRK